MYKIAPILLMLILILQKLPLMASEKYDHVVEKKIALDLKANYYPLNDSISGIEYANIQYHQQMRIVPLKGNLVFNNLWLNIESQLATPVGSFGVTKNGKIQPGAANANVNLNGQLAALHGVTKNGKIF